MRTKSRRQCRWLWLPSASASRDTQLPTMTQGGTEREAAYISLPSQKERGEIYMCIYIQRSVCLHRAIRNQPQWHTWHAHTWHARIRTTRHWRRRDAWRCSGRSRRLTHCSCTTQWSTTRKLSRYYTHKHSHTTKHTHRMGRERGARS